MTDINELAQSLKAAAENAIGAHERLAAYPYAEIIDISQHKGEQIDIDITDLNEFNKEANPVNILALVEALEKAQLRIDEMESDEVRQRLANAEHQLYMAELAKNNLRASRKAQFRKRKAAEKRIAELESRTVNVKLPTTIEPAAFSPWVAKAFYQFHKDTVKSCFAVFSDACAAAGIKVEAE
ncbi:TPA: ead/Ea22-like family protein [Klebsiella pneumoniae]|nr:ead/Ea22-like family protein [Klebsiella pneumoniae]HBQ1746362.1 ead/Ea22-like family protein [Klebsiella pneumoniae]HEE1350338.1 ead/Ea22-like family protein [Klebsiella pneumoniae]